MQSSLLDRHSTAVYNQPDIPLSKGTCFRCAVVMLYCAAMADRQNVLTRLIAQYGGTGLGNILATFLDAAGPLALLGAQLVYGLEPLLGSGWSEVGGALEDPEQLEQLIEALRSGEGERT